MNTGHIEQKANKTLDVAFLFKKVTQKNSERLDSLHLFYSFFGAESRFVAVLKKKRVVKYIPFYIFGRTKYVKILIQLCKIAIGFLQFIAGRNSDRLNIKLPFYVI